MPTTKLLIWIQITAVDVMEQTLPQMRRNLAAVIPARKCERLTQAFRGHLDEGKTWNNASGSITENDWTNREKKDAGFKEVFVSTRSLGISTLRQEGVSAMATCTSMI